MRLQLHGSRGSAVIDDEVLEYLHTTGGAPVPVADPRGGDPFVLGHLRQYEDVVDAIERGRPPAVRVEDGLRALATVHAVYRSAQAGRRVTLAEVLGD
jgi:UDP-N-acetyl-2-amino-2-deoxyglucuronate dehydrogenase